MKIFSTKLVIPLLGVLAFLSLGVFVNAQDCGSDLQCQIDQIQRELEARLPAQEHNKQELAGLRKQLDELSKKITGISNQIKTRELEINKREEDLAYTQQVFDEKTASHYKFIRLYDPILPFLSSSDAAQAFREIAFRQRAADEDRKAIEKYASDLAQLKRDKDTLEKNKASLASLQKQVNTKATFLQGEVDKVEAYLSSLTARQQELIALKEGGFQTSIGDVPPTLEPCTGDPRSSNFCPPSFDSRPAFAGFSFGAPHRKGMSQFGAYGRARARQSAEDIIHAYYGGIEIRKDYPSSNICVGSSRSNCTNVDLETYTKRIYEMPSSWTDNDSAALKAQAVAARSYALASMQSYGYICTTEACQVYKPVNKGGAWDDAVEKTKGWVTVINGQPFSAWYASTAGGYTLSYTSNGYSTPGQWDAPSGLEGWKSGNAWDKKGGSPWFYKGWFRTRSGASCGQTNPWLTSVQMADILNAWKVLYGGTGDTSRISPTSCGAPNAYSTSELQSIGGYHGVTDASVIYGNDGATASVRFTLDDGSSVSIPGDQFKKAFNLRAPGYIGLKSSLFNIEKL